MGFGWFGTRQRPCEERVEFEKLRGVVSRLVVRQSFLEFLLPEFPELADVLVAEKHEGYRSPRACGGEDGLLYRLRTQG